MALAHQTETLWRGGESHAFYMRNNDPFLYMRRVLDLKIVALLRTIFFFFFTVLIGL